MIRIERKARPGTRVALVTGASRGLGRVVAGFLARQGYALVIDARGTEELGKAVAELRSSGAEVEGVAGDVGEAEHRRELLRRAAALGALHILMNNASDLGPSPLLPLAGYPLHTLREVLETNLIAPLALVQEASGALARSGGLVVNVSSDAALGGYEGWGGYGASKAALDLVSKTLGAELKGTGIAVVSVDPGDMRTKMHQDAFPGQDISDRPLPESTLPFWAWLFGQERAAVSGKRFQAQAAVWQVAA